MSQSARVLPRHEPAFDGIRGLAILLVLAHNMNLLEAPQGALSRVTALGMDWGWVGVQLFFVLSGFLITDILLATRNEPGYYRNFFARRVLRIFPLYYAVLFVTFGLVPLLFGKQVAGHENQVWLWTYLSNWTEPAGHEVPLFPHFWSLAVEEQFYFVWPLVIHWRKPSLRRIMWICAGLSVAALAIRALLRASGAGHEGPYMYTVCRIDALAMGAAIAALLRLPAGDRLVTWRRPLIVSASLLFVGGALATRGYPRSSVPTQTFGYTILAIVFTFLIALVASSAATAGRRGLAARLLSLRPLRTAGKYSYAMYVLHIPFHLALGAPLARRIFPGIDRDLGAALLYFVGATVIVFLGALASYHLLEKHFLKMKRLFSAPRQPVEPPELAST